MPVMPVMPVSETCQRALRHLAIRPCVQLNPDLLTHCRPVALRSTGEAFPKASMRLYGTWQPKHTSVFTLVQAKTGGTMIYSHETESLYHAAPSVQLAPETPPYTALLAQWCEDIAPDSSPEAGRATPHLLIFDILNLNEPRPHVRGARLRSMERMIPKPMCVVQWAGDIHLLKTFVHPLPHETGAVVAHTRDPLVFASYADGIQ